MSASQAVSFDRIADRYDATRIIPVEQQDRIARGILAAVGGRMGTRFVEPGVGTGRIALPLLRQGVTYTGTDISPQMLEQMRRKLKREPWLAGCASLVEADATSLPLDDASFDVALTAHLLHLIPEWRRVVDEIRRVVRRGGYYVHANDNAGPVYAALNRAWGQFAQSRGLAALSHPPVSEHEILAHLGLGPDAMTQYTLARWSSPVPIADALRRFRDRESSRLWHLSVEDHAALMSELEAWVAANYGSLEGVVPSEASFHISAIRLAI